MTSSARARVRRIGHLAGGFLRALWPADVSAADDDSVRRALTPAEYSCWSSMPRADRREGLRTMRRLTDELGPDVQNLVVAAALLHDAGKARSGLGPVGRALATLATITMPKRVEQWGHIGGWRGRVCTYSRHDREGERVLRSAGARPEVAAWAGAHHTPAAWCGLGFEAGTEAALAKADGEVGADR